MASADSEIVIKVEGLKNQFGDQVVHDGLDLEVRRGEIIGVVGGSGSGKSVLLRSIIGLNKPRAGRITIFGVEPASLGEAEQRALERRWGVLFQEGALFSSLNVLQNVEVALREHLRMKPPLIDEIAALKLKMVGLDPAAVTKMPSELSGGMKKRSGLARALVLDPELVFLDEPTAGLDPIGAAAFDQLIGGLHKTLGLTVFLVTHDLDTLYAVCDRIAVLAEKRVIAIGTIKELLANNHPWIQEYFNGPRGRLAAHAQENN
jgi:phospholipid/cholesterol/gamma-HCH transport system ATP-binding protein